MNCKMRRILRISLTHFEQVVVQRKLKFIDLVFHLLNPSYLLLLVVSNLNKIVRFERQKTPNGSMLKRKEKIHEYLLSECIGRHLQQTAPLMVDGYGDK